MSLPWFPFALRIESTRFKLRCGPYMQASFQHLTVPSLALVSSASLTDSNSMSLLFVFLVVSISNSEPRSSTSVSERVVACGQEH